MSKKYPARTAVKQQLIDNPSFLDSLTKLLSQNNASIYLTQKRLPKEFSTSAMDSAVEAIQSFDVSMSNFAEAEDEYEILFRATNGKDQKFSTRVRSNNVLAFMEKYGEVCRGGMGAGLKKRDRKKTKKAGR